MTHICISKLTIIGSDSGLSPGRYQAIIWANAGISWNTNRISNIFIQENAFQNIVWKMAVILFRPQCVKCSTSLTYSDTNKTFYVEVCHCMWISLGWCKKDATPLLTHWSYVLLALTHRYTHRELIQNWCHSGWSYRDRAAFYLCTMAISHQDLGYWHFATLFGFAVVWKQWV